MANSGVTLSQQVASLKDAFYRFDRMMVSNFEELEQALEVLGSSDLSLQQKFDVVIDSEYLITRLRSKVLLELSRIQSVMSNPTNSETINRQFKERYNSVISTCQRLNELREDFSVVQRSMYARSFNKM